MENLKKLYLHLRNGNQSVHSLFIVIGYIIIVAVVMFGAMIVLGDSSNWLAYAVISTFFCLVIYGALFPVRVIDFGLLLLVAALIVLFVYQSSVVTGDLTDLRFYPISDWSSFIFRSMFLVLPVAAGVSLRLFAGFVRERLSGRL